jgi:hypothetical protein
MRRTLCIAVAAVAIGCGGEKNVSNATQSDGPAASTAQSVPGGQTPATEPGPESAARDRTSSAANDAVSNQLVTLTGCLTGGEAPAASASSSSSSVTQGSSGANGANSGNNRFVLKHAAPEPGAAGVGASGAGASGGPLVSGASDYRLQGGDIAELRGHLGHQVRITARLNTQQMSVPQGTASGGAAGDSRSPESSTVGSGATRVPRAIPSDVPSGENATAASVQSLVVESVQMVAATCAQR